MPLKSIGYMGMMAEKECRGCGETKPLVEFYRRPDGRGNGRARCKACYAAEKTARRRADPAKANAYRKKYTERRRAAGLNPEGPGFTFAKQREKAERYREQNPGRGAARQKANYYADLHASRARSRENSRRRRAGRDAEAVAYGEILRFDPCAYCGEAAGTVDHVHARANGGSNAWDNLTAACGSCNSSKCAEPLLPFLLRRVTSSSEVAT